MITIPVLEAMTPVLDFAATVCADPEVAHFHAIAEAT
jgi:hypothetical protein